MRTFRYLKQNGKTKYQSRKAHKKNGSAVIIKALGYYFEDASKRRFFSASLNDA